MSSVIVVGGASVLRRELMAWLAGDPRFDVRAVDSHHDLADEPDASAVVLCLADDAETLTACVDGSRLVIAFAFAPSGPLRAAAERLGVALVDSADSPLPIVDHLDLAFSA